MAFVMKRVHGSECLGPDLIELRERAGLTIAEASQQTKIIPSFIQSLENERLEDIPDPVYSERLLRSYVSQLGGNVSYYLHKYRGCLETRGIIQSKNESLPRPIRLRTKDLLVTPRLLAIAGFGVFVILLGGYVYYQVRAIATAPPLEVSEPVEGMRYEDPTITVRGKTLSEATVRINDQSAIVHPDGTFEKTLYISRGTTEVHVTARRRYGDEASITRRVIYERELPPLPGQTEPSTAGVK